jgi:hypothetical protein
MGGRTGRFAWGAAAVLAGCVAALIFGAAALAQGGAPAPDFSEPCPALYPGDDAGQERIARWMARSAADRGLPGELPVMAGIAESGLRNLRGASYAGFFGMSRALNTGEYRGFPRNPDLQVRWFLDTAGLVRQRRVAEGRPDPAADESAFGVWIADVERPAPENRSGYQRHLSEARDLIANRCAAPKRGDTTPPRLRTRIATTQQPLAAGGIVVKLRCPDHDCLAGAAATIDGRTRRAGAITPAERGFTTLTVPVPRAARRALRRGRSVQADVAAIAADASANATARHRAVTLRR